MNMRCANCQNWRNPDADNIGECWSLDRLDHDISKGPAGYHAGDRVCEAWLKKLPALPPEHARAFKEGEGR